jgi:hypothetical protein
MDLWDYNACLDMFRFAEGSTIHLNPIEDIWSQLSHCEMSRTNPEKDSLMTFGITMTARLLDTGPAENEPERHFGNFCAYRLRKSGISGPGLPTSYLTPSFKQPMAPTRTNLKPMFAHILSQGLSFVLNRALIGLGPQPTAKEDACFVILGAKTPFILRSISLDSHYKILGEAYVHGIMRGETVAAEYYNDVEDIILC